MMIGMMMRSVVVIGRNEKHKPYLEVARFL